MTKTVQTAEIDLHTAIQIALHFFKETFGEYRLENVRLEEVERSDDGKHWLITIGYNDPALQIPIPLMPPSVKIRDLRQYKIIRVDALTGKAVSVKIRD